MALIRSNGQTHPIVRAHPLIKIRAIESTDFPEWLNLWNANNLGHKDEDVTSQTWARLNDENAPVHGLVAEDKGEIVGLIQYILHPTTGSLNDICYMQDVFVDPAHRQKGIARTMIEALAKIGKREQWGRIYWMAEGKNEAAQALYKTLGHKLDFTLHILPTTP